ncbi:ScbR family autoregulator-binding transcription factor [Streptomyces sp. NPDC006711]|uniref:ScbR family autoregulator-binding transcription factor n=1 Tax=Streptomyces sp. NPDC006711 TaxID=3364762 RepID=UPI00368D0BC1
MTKQERATRTRAALIHSAARLFEERGYLKAGLTEISAGAGVSRGALTFHFETKAAVSGAVEDVAIRALRRAARQASQSQDNSLQAMIDMSHSFAYLLNDDVVVRAGYRLNCNADLRSGLNLLQQWQSCVQQLAGLAADEGSLRPEASQEALVTTVVATTTGLEVLSWRNSAWLSRSSLAGFWRQLLSAVATPGAQASTDPNGTDAVLDQLASVPRQFGPAPARSAPADPHEATL